MPPGQLIIHRCTQTGRDRPTGIHREFKPRSLSVGDRGRFYTISSTHPSNLSAHSWAPRSPSVPSFRPNKPSCRTQEVKSVSFFSLRPAAWRLRTSGGVSERYPWSQVDVLAGRGERRGKSSVASFVQPRRHRLNVAKEMVSSWPPISLQCEPSNLATSFNLLRRHCPFCSREAYRPSERRVEDA